MIICLSGFATSGKDTFFKLLSENSITPFLPSQYKRVAFGDELKKSASPYIKSTLNIDIFNCTKEEKEIARPILISIGCWARDNISDTYWVNKVLQQTSMNEKMGYHTVVCDARFVSEYEELIGVFGPKNVIGVRIIRTDSNYTPPNEELKNDPLLDPYIDYTVKWKTESNIYNLINHIKDFGNWLKNRG